MFIEFESLVETSPYSYPPQIASFTAGFLANDIFITLWSLLAGGLITALVVVPPWPVYNKNPVVWLPAGGGGGNDINQDAETEKKQGKQIVYEDGQVKLI